MEAASAGARTTASTAFPPSSIKRRQRRRAEGVGGSRRQPLLRPRRRCLASRWPRPFSPGPPPRASWPRPAVPAAAWRARGRPRARRPCAAASWRRRRRRPSSVGRGGVGRVVAPAEGGISNLMDEPCPSSSCRRSKRGRRADSASDASGSVDAPASTAAAMPAATFFAALLCTARGGGGTGRKASATVAQLSSATRFIVYDVRASPAAVSAAANRRLVADGASGLALYSSSRCAREPWLCNLRLEAGARGAEPCPRGRWPVGARRGGTAPQKKTDFRDTARAALPRGSAHSS